MFPYSRRIFCCNKIEKVENTSYDFVATEGVCESRADMILRNSFLEKRVLSRLSEPT